MERRRRLSGILDETSPRASKQSFGKHFTVSLWSYRDIRPVEFGMGLPQDSSSSVARFSTVRQLVSLVGDPER
ncbi:hypothetical protein AVEN_120527-1 [Araneus ventricosus]|uniref:Uncharacterized protein n=1 Tax=Araneus ventricosus TaxID=182803 RepID=A0A4Y2IEV4_ARAVE|nr:hypothetical protein AVEN_120527-1 [Araneus ventricosus]